MFLSIKSEYDDIKLKISLEFQFVGSEFTTFGELVNIIGPYVNAHFQLQEAHYLTLEKKLKEIDQNKIYTINFHEEQGQVTIDFEDKEKIVLLDSLDDEQDKMHESILLDAKRSYQRHNSSVRGQQTTRADSFESHVVWATLNWIEEQAKEKTIDLSIYTKEQKSLLLFLESSATESGGLIIGSRMNSDDHNIAKEWAKDGFIQYGRIANSDIDSERPNPKTHWVTLSDDAWATAQTLRKQRAERLEKSIKRERLGYII